MQQSKFGLPVTATGSTQKKQQHQRFNPMYHGIRVISNHEFWFDVADPCLLLMILLIAECIMD